MLKRSTVALAAFVILVSSVPCSRAQCPLTDQVSAPGRDISVAGDLALVGGANQAVLLKRQGGTWVQDATLNPSDTGPVTGFGLSVALGPTRAAVSAMSPEKVYVFDLGPTGWVQTAALTPTSPTGTAGFGGDVALHGDRIAVTATSAGGVFLFDKIGPYWLNTAEGWLYGTWEYPASVALGSDRLVIADPAYYEGVSHFGRVLTFAYNDSQWELKQTIKGYHERIGTMPSMDGDALAIGVDGIGEESYPGIRVYGWNAGTWKDVGGVVHSQVKQYSTALKGNDLLVGLRMSGKDLVYTYRKSGDSWTNVGSLQPANGTTTDQFGFAVVIAEAEFLIGSPGGGNVYIAPRQPAFEAYGTGCPGGNPWQIKPTLSFKGCPGPGGTVTLSIGGGFGGPNALVFFGLHKASIPINAACSLLISPVLPLQLVLPLNVGSVSAGFVVPASVPSVTITTQAFILEQTPSVFANTNGVLITMG